MTHCTKCGAPVAMLRRVCDECKRTYQREYARAHSEENRQRAKAWMQCRRWLDGGERLDDLGPVIPHRLRSQNGRSMI